MARLRVQPRVIEACLNHRSGVIRGVASVYNRHAYTDEKRAALDLWAEHVERCAGNIIIARPVEAAKVPETGGFSELIARPGAVADNRELEPA